jgi:hypothetical protein
MNWIFSVVVLMETPYMTPLWQLANSLTEKQEGLEELLFRIVEVSRVVGYLVFSTLIVELVLINNVN